MPGSNPARQVALHPDHLADLRKSGLTDTTIQAAGTYTVPPDEIGQGKNRKGLPEGVVSALAFPYPGFDGYERFKIWWEEGRTGPKYLAKGGTPNHFYLPPHVDLKGDSHLLIGEGEKKALSLTQAGYQVVGIGGVFNWLNKGDDGDSHPLPDFDLVNWNRPVTILFDSDGADNPNVRLAAWRLAREVAKRGGQVDVLFFPAGTNGDKVGADDFLMKHGPGALAELLKTAWPFDPALNDHEAEINWQLRGITPESELLDKIKSLDRLIPILAEMGRTETTAILEGLRERFKLRAKDLTDLVFDIKKARKHKRKEGSSVPTLDKLQDVRRLHSAIDFPGDSSVLGFRVDIPGDNPVGLLLVIHNGEGVKVEVILPDRGIEQVEIGEEIYQIKPGSPPFLRDVWGLDQLKLFMAHPTYPKGLYQDLVAAYKTFLDLPEPAYGLMAAWTVATYYAHLFAAFPFLHFHGPKESGKSKALEAMRCTCFNAWKGRDVTAAALGDTVDGQRGTVLLDQAERLNNDEYNNLVGLLADSYKKAGGQRRVVEMTNGGRSVLEFSTYGPKAFASTKPLDPDLADRCVKIPMTRTRRRLPDLEGWEKIWGELRDKLYRFTLAAFKVVRYRYEVNPGDGTRIGELWRPMLAVLLSLGVEDGEVESIRTLFMEAAKEGRHEPTGWECTLLEVLRDEAQVHDDKFEMTVADILKAMNIEGDKQPGNKWIGDTLSRYHLSLGRRRAKVEGTKQTIYKFDPARVKELCEIYLRDTPPDDLSHLSQGDNANDSNGFEGTRENQGTRPHLSPMSPDDKDGGDIPGPVPIDECVPQELYENTEELVEGTEGQAKTGMAENNSHLFSGDDVDPLAGEL